MATTVDQKLLRQTKFPPEFNKKVDMTKVNVEVMKKWIASKISEILGNEDDVVIELCFNLLEGAKFPDIKVLQIQLTGFLDKDTAKFCKELWNLCLSAQDNPQGVPKELLEAKKLELIQEKIDAEKVAEDTRRRNETEGQRERNIDSIRNRERAERGRGRGRGGRGDQGGYRPRDYDRSPRGAWRRGQSRERSLTPPRRDIDSYSPRMRGGRFGDRRARSPPRRYRDSRSRTPPRRRRRNTSSPSVTPPRPREPRNDKSDPRSRARSFTPSSVSRSPSPGLRRRRGPSRSPTPPSRSSYRRRRYSPHSAADGPPPRRRRRSPSSSSASDDSRDRSADRDKGRRAPPRSPPRRRNSSSESSSRTPPRRGAAQTRKRESSSRSRSRSREKRKDKPIEHGRKRHRSIERYAPAQRRRRNTSSSVESSPREKRRKEGAEEGGQHERSAKVQEVNARRALRIDRYAPQHRSRASLDLPSQLRLQAQRLSPVQLTPQTAPPIADQHSASPSQSPSTQLPRSAPLQRSQAELRGRLLKERIIARRKSSIDQIAGGTEGADLGDETKKGTA